MYIAVSPRLKLKKCMKFAKLNITSTDRSRKVTKSYKCRIYFLLLFPYFWISKTIEMIGVPEKRLEIYNSFSGVNGNEVFEIRSLQLDQLLDLTVTLGRLKHIIFGDRVDIFEFETVFTLFEFIDGIAWALSFQVIPTRCEIRR